MPWLEICGEAELVPDLHFVEVPIASHVGVSYQGRIFAASAGRRTAAGALARKGALGSIVPWWRRGAHVGRLTGGGLVAGRVVARTPIVPLPGPFKKQDTKH